MPIALIQQCCHSESVCVCAHVCALTMGRLEMVLLCTGCSRGFKDSMPARGCNQLGLPISRASFQVLLFRALSLSMLFELVTWLASTKSAVSHYDHPLQLNTAEMQRSRTLQDSHDQQVCHKSMHAKVTCLLTCQ